MASYICDISKELPSRETFGILAGKEALYKGHHCTHIRGAEGSDLSSSCGEISTESCNMPSAIKNRCESTIQASSASSTCGCPAGKETFGILEGKDVAYFGGESQGENLMNKWRSDSPKP